MTQPGRTFKVHSTVTTNATCSAARGPIRAGSSSAGCGDFTGLRYDQYKAVFMEQPAHGLEVWMQPFVPLRAPKLFNLRSDPFDAQNMRRVVTTDGSLNTSSSWSRPKRSSANSWPHSRSSRRGRSRAAARSIKPCKN